MTYCDFNIDHWRDTLMDARGLDYRFYSFGDWIESPKPAERSILLRHDVDVSLEIEQKYSLTLLLLKMWRKMRL